VQGGTRLNFWSSNGLTAVHSHEATYPVALLPPGQVSLVVGFKSLTPSVASGGSKTFNLLAKKTQRPGET